MSSGQLCAPVKVSAYFQEFVLKAPSGLHRILSLTCTPPPPLHSSYSLPAGKGVRVDTDPPKCRRAVTAITKKEVYSLGFVSLSFTFKSNVNVPCRQAALLHMLIKDPSPVPSSRRLMHPVGRWINGMENINLPLSCLLEIDTHHFCSHCFHFVGENQPTTGSHPDARGAKKCAPGWQCFPAKLCAMKGWAGVFIEQQAIFATRISPLFFIFPLTQGL